MRGKYYSRCRVVRHFNCPDYFMGPKVVKRRTPWKISKPLNLRLCLKQNNSSHISENRPLNHYYTIYAAFDVQVL